MTTLKPFTREEHHKNVYRQLELSTQHRELILKPDERRRQKVRQELEELEDEYIHRLPILQLSRCPYCNEPLLRQFDPYDLNGEWWNPLWHDRDDPPTCKHFLVLQGALNLNGLTPTEVQTKDGIVPGPEVPFVIPRLLEMEGMVTVVHTLPVAGRYTAYPIGYFAFQRPLQTENTQSWCRATFSLDEVMWTSRNEHYDYDIIPWVKRGKVFWLDPNDPTLPVAKGPPENYPFSHVTGRHSFYSLVKGEIRPWFS